MRSFAMSSADNDFHGSFGDGTSAAGACSPAVNEGTDEVAEDKKLRQQTKEQVEVSIVRGAPSILTNTSSKKLKESALPSSTRVHYMQSCCSTQTQTLH